MKTAMGFLGGRFGDLILLEPTIRAFLAQNPDFNLVLLAYKKYADVLNFYERYSDRIIGFYKDEYYNRLPKEEEAREFMRLKNIDLLFSPMPAHKDPQWPLYRHQTIECGDMFDIKVEDPKIRLPLPPHVPENKKSVAISLFPNNGEGVKALSPQKIGKIIAYVKQKGYSALQLNGPDEPVLEGAAQTNTSFYRAGTAMLGCKMLITGDTAMSWLASAFDFPVLGLYSISYYPFCDTSKNWNPINKNAVYLEAPKAEDIPDELIFRKIDELL